MSSETGCLRVGVVGLGEHATGNLLPTLCWTEGLRVGGVCCRDPNRLAATAERWGANVATTNLYDLVNAKGIDVVVTAAPPQVHEEVVRECLRAQKHVFVEKPPAFSLMSLQQLIAQAAARPSVVTFVDYNFLYSEAFSVATSVLSANRSSVSASRLRLIARKPLAPLWGLNSIVQSFLMAVGIHGLAILCDIMGAPASVACEIVELEGGRFSLGALIHFENGGSSVVEFGNYSNRLEFRCEMVTSDGLVVISDDFHNVQVYSAGAQRADKRLSEKSVEVFDIPALQAGSRTAGYQGALAAFRDSCWGLRESPVPLRDSLPIYDLITAIELAARRGTRVTLSDLSS